MNRILVLLLALMSLMSFVPDSAFAHRMSPSLLEIHQVGKNEYSVFWRTPRIAMVKPEPVFPNTCKKSHQNIRTDLVAAEWRWRMACPGGLEGKTLGVSRLDQSGTTVLLRIHLRGKSLQQQLLNAGTPSYQVPKAAGGANMLLQYLGLGARHILVGIDHLLFITGLFLLARNWRQLAATVTAFTLGHSVTLALVALQLIPRWPALVELGIAATILVLALELGRSDGGSETFLARYPWPVAASFGLVHGLGFAEVMSNLGLSSREIIPALFSFNIGIECGQLIFVSTLALMFYVAGAAHKRLYTWCEWAAIYVMGSMAVFWCIERALVLIHEMGYASSILSVA